MRICGWRIAQLIHPAMMLTATILCLVRPAGAQKPPFPPVPQEGAADPVPALSQQAFETMLVDGLRRMDPGRAVWVDEVLLLGDAVGLPASLHDALSHAPALRLDVSLSARVAALADCL